MRKSRRITTDYGPSQTIPGQSLTPGEVLKRHLAGTLPPIDHAAKYEYHFNEDGEQVAVPVPLELHEIHKLSLELRKRQWEEAIESRREAAEKHKQDIIDEYEKQKLAKEEPPRSSGLDTDKPPSNG